MRASSSSELGAFSAMTRNSSRLPADSTLAKDSVEVNQTFGSFDETRRSPPLLSGAHRSVTAICSQTEATVAIENTRSPWCRSVGGEPCWKAPAPEKCKHLANG